jgi:hypothetical protein
MKKQKETRAIEFKINQNPNDINSLISLMKQFTIKDDAFLNQSVDVNNQKEIPEGFIINELEKLIKYNDEK